ncbi:MAG: FtsL-like putative cell division protein [Porphyromonas sp.]|nr:FtsL-like putative cell division protein [Porphyromonas sp.]
MEKKNRAQRGTPAQGGTQNRRRGVDRFWNFLEGGVLEHLFTRRSIAWIVSIGLFFLLHIYNSYRGLHKIRMISDQKNHLVELRMEHVSTSTLLMSRQRLSSVEDRVQEKELGIEIPKSSPIIIER